MILDLLSWSNLSNNGSNSNLQVPGVTICRQGYKGMNVVTAEYESILNTDILCDAFIKNVTRDKRYKTILL